MKHESYDAYDWKNIKIPCHFDDNSFRYSSISAYIVDWVAYFYVNLDYNYWSFFSWIKSLPCFSNNLRFYFKVN